MRRASRFAALSRGAFTLAALFVARPATAHAERVLVLHPEPVAGQGTAAGTELLSRVEGATIAALVSMSHEPVRDESASPPADTAVPAVGAERGAVYVVRVRAIPTQAGYVAQATVYDVRGRTQREASGEIVPVREVSQLVELLTPLLAGAPETPAASGAEATSETEPADVATGSGTGATPAGSEPATGTPPEAAAEPGATTDSEAGAREAWGERERERQETARREAWENRERYGVPEQLLFQGGIAMRPIVNRPAAVDTPMMGALELRFGYGIAKAPGLEVRGSVEGAFGSLSGFGLMGGAVYLFSPFIDAPVHFGPGLEVGWLQGFATGFHQAFFALRVSNVVSWRFRKSWYLEGAAPEIMMLTGGSVAATVGVAVRVGYRF